MGWGGAAGRGGTRCRAHAEGPGCAAARSAPWECEAHAWRMQGESRPSEDPSPHLLRSVPDAPGSTARPPLVCGSTHTCPARERRRGQQAEGPPTPGTAAQVPLWFRGRVARQRWARPMHTCRVRCALPPARLSAVPAASATPTAHPATRAAPPALPSARAPPHLPHEPHP